MDLLSKIEWPPLTFGPVNLWVVIPAKEFYELMEKYHIPKEEYETMIKKEEDA